MAGLAALMGSLSGATSMLNTIGSGFKNISQSISNFIQNIKDTAKKVEDAFGTAWDMVKEKWNTSVVEPLQPFFDFMSESISSLSGWFDETFNKIHEAYIKFMLDPWGSLIDFILDIPKMMLSGFTVAFEGLGKMWDGALILMGALWDIYLTTPIGKFWSWLGGKGSEALNFLGGIWEGIGNAWDTYVTEPFGAMWDWVMDKAAAFGEFVWGIISPIAEAVDNLTGGFLGDAVGTVGGWLGFSQGGIASGPSSGYPAMLHGTEAIVPLPNGRSIPVEMSGGGGHSFNMTFNLSGLTDRSDKRQFARDIGNMVQQEVARSLGTTTMRGRY